MPGSNLAHQHAWDDLFFHHLLRHLLLSEEHGTRPDLTDLKVSWLAGERLQHWLVARPLPSLASVQPFSLVWHVGSAGGEFRAAKVLRELGRIDMHPPTVSRLLVNVVQDPLIAILCRQHKEHHMLGPCVFIHPILFKFCMRKSCFTWFKLRGGMSWQFLQKLGVCDTDVARGCQSFGQIFYIFSCRTSLGHPLFTQPPDFLLSLFPGGEGFIEGAAEGGV